MSRFSCYVGSSIGRAAVSKTAGYRFDSCPTCYSGRASGRPSDDAQERDGYVPRFDMNKIVSYFELYKPTQGKYVRWGTVIGMALIVGLGMLWMGSVVLRPNGMLWQSVGVMIFGAVGAAVTYLVVNRPRTAEFLIMTESEMRKVNWPSRQVVINSTKVVIFLTLMFAIMLFAVDGGFIQLFRLVGVLPQASPS